MRWIKHATILHKVATKLTLCRGICRAAPGGASPWIFRPADGRLFSRPSGALKMCRLRRHRLPGPAPAGGPISCTDKKWGKEAAGGCAPLTPAPPPVGLQPKSAAPCHGSIGGCSASRLAPRRGRNASARESPEPYRKCARGGTSAFAWRAAPTGRRKTARLRRARAQGARTPGTGVVFRRGSPASHPVCVVGSVRNLN